MNSKKIAKIKTKVRDYAPAIIAGVSTGVALVLFVLYRQSQKKITEYENEEVLITTPEIRQKIAEGSVDYGYHIDGKYYDLIKCVHYVE